MNAVSVALGCMGALVIGGCSASHDVRAASSTTNDEQTEYSARAGAPGTAVAGRSSTAPIGVATGPVNTDDITFAFDATVPAGAEMFRCLYAQMPTDRGVIAVPRVESNYTPGSHHLLAYRSNLTSVPEGRTGAFDCQDGLWQLNQRGSYYEAQQPHESRQLPKGIAHKFQPGEVMIIEAHYINTTDTQLDARVELTMHPTDPAEVEQEAGSIFFNNYDISVPAHGTATSMMTCELTQDISLALLWSHMHKRGVRFFATTNDEEAAERLGMLYEESDWAEPRPREYPSDPPVVLHAGTSITFGCEFKNDSDASFRFGTSAATNEMCILHGMYWPRMPSNAEQCLRRTTMKQ